MYAGKKSWYAARTWLSRLRTGLSELRTRLFSLRTCPSDRRTRISTRRVGDLLALPAICIAVATLLASAFTALAAEPLSTDPAEELASFKVAEGFEVSLFASEAQGVVKPIQMRWDARGRLWVITSTSYPQIKPGEEPNDKVLILEDTDGDGRADKTTVFADGLLIPTGIEIAPVSVPATPLEPLEKVEIRAPRLELNVVGEVAAADPPKIRDSVAALERERRMPSAAYIGEGSKLWLMTDTDGDGKADKKEVVLRGFGTGDNHQNINSFRWSPGGELFFSQGLHAYSRVETPHGIVALDEAGFFRYRPREQRLDAFYGGHADPQNPWGFVWTDWGQMLMVAGNNGGVYWPLPEMIRGFQKGRRDQIWEGARGRKTSGPDIIGTAHFPPEWQGRFVTGGYINNAVWTMAIEDDGAGFKLTDREPLLTSTHGSFRPVDVKIGPDGAAYICDWFNPIIGHYQSSFRHPDRDKAHGRIWRVSHKTRPLVKPPKIAGAELGELFENLKSGERWVCEQTKRELAGRETEEVVKAARAWWKPVGKSADLAGLDDAAKLKILIREERVLMELLGVFEAHGVAEKALLQHVATSNSADVRAYVASQLGRQMSQLLLRPDQMTHTRAPFNAPDTLEHFARDKNARVRCAAVVAAASYPNDYAVRTLGLARNDDGDKNLELAARSALSVLGGAIASVHKVPRNWEPQIYERLAALQRPPASPKSAPAAKSAVQITPTVPATGTLRATPEFVAELVKEVREKGNAGNGATVYARPELACVACHSIADHGGKIGPPLDAIGTGQPLDFIIGATLEPQREIKESYEARQLTAKDGRVALGYIVQRDAAATTLRDPGTGAETKMLAAEIAELKPLGSFMPAGLVDRLTREDLRDLFAYLAQLGRPRP